MKNRYIYRIFYLTLSAILLLDSCHRKQDEFALDDPTQTYSIIQSDSNSGIDIVSDCNNNPMKVRSFIDNYEIPETTYAARKSKFCSLLDELKRRMNAKDSAYDEIDSLNYMAIHYLQNLLSDPQSLRSPIRHSILKSIVSNDGKMRVYSWNENISRSMSSYINIFQYQQANGQVRAFFNKNVESDSEMEFTCGKMEKAYRIRTENDSLKLYLFCFSGIGGNENFYKGAGCIRVDGDSLDFDYPAFKKKKNARQSLLFRYQMNDKATLEYKPENQVLSLTKISLYENATDTARLRLQFEKTGFTPLTD